MRDEMTTEINAALDECSGIIRKASKSCSLAARLFDPATRDAAFFLYGWCRYCDDQVDAVGPCEKPNVVLDRVIVDKNARIGDGVRLTNAAGLQEGEGPGYVIRNGVIIVPKDGVVPAGTVG